LPSIAVAVVAWHNVHSKSKMIMNAREAGEKPGHPEIIKIKNQPVVATLASRPVQKTINL